MEVLGRAQEVALRRVIGRVDDQRAPLPSAPRVAMPVADTLRQVWTTIERNDPGVVDQLRNKYHVSGCLHDLVIGVVCGITAEPRFPVRDAANEGTEFFGAGRRMRSGRQER